MEREQTGRGREKKVRWTGRFHLFLCFMLCDSFVRTISTELVFPPSLHPLIQIKKSGCAAHLPLMLQCWSLSQRSSGTWGCIEPAGGGTFELPRRPKANSTKWVISWWLFGSCAALRQIIHLTIYSLLIASQRCKNACYQPKSLFVYLSCVSVFSHLWSSVWQLIMAASVTQSICFWSLSSCRSN